MAAGLTQSELAERAGTRQGAVSAYETGRRDPTFGTLERLLRATGHEVELSLTPTGGEDAALPATPLAQAVAAHKAEIRSIVESYGGGGVGVFGSVARGDDHEGSDLDLLVELPARTSFFKLGAIAREIGELLSVDVDVVPEVALRPEIRERVLQEVIRL